MLDRTGLDAHFAANPVKVREHMATDDDDDVATSGLPIDFGSFASHGGGQAITYGISSSDPLKKVLEIKDPHTGVVTLTSTGVDFDVVEEDSDDEPDNTVKYTVSANDGTRTVDYEFSVEITTNYAQADVANEAVEHVDGDDEDEDPDHYVVTVEKSFKQDDRGETLADLKDYITGADTPDTLTYSIVSAKPEITIGSTPGDSELILNYVPDPDDVDYGMDDALSYTVVVTIDDDYDTQTTTDATPEYILDLTLTLNITVNVEPPPRQLYPVAEVDVDENLTDVVVLAAGNVKLAEIIADAIGDVEVTHAGGSGAGAA